MTWDEAKSKASPCPRCNGVEDLDCRECEGHGKLMFLRCPKCKTVWSLKDADMWCPCGGDWSEDGCFPNAEGKQ